DIPLMRPLEARDEEARVRPGRVDPDGRAHQRCQVMLDLVSARTGQQADDRRRASLLLGQEGGVEALLRQGIKVRMPDVVGRHAVLLIPYGFEGEGTQDVIDPALHLAHAPAAPGPELRRYKIKDWDAPGMGPTRHPPVEAGKIDQYHGIRTLALKEPIRLDQQA